MRARKTKSTKQENIQYITQNTLHVRIYFRQLSIQGDVLLNTVLPGICGNVSTSLDIA